MREVAGSTPSLDIVTCRYIFTQGSNILGEIVTKVANCDGVILKFDLCDLGIAQRYPHTKFH
jgi:hypothetical protein